MANTFVVSRSHLAFGLCLPLAVLLGYMLAEPLESSSLAIVVMVLTILAVPVLMRWHQPLLVICWNATINPLFLPGRPYVWTVLAFVSLFFAVLNRSVNAGNRFLYAPSVARPLLLFGGVVAVTAVMTGGVGSRVFGSETYGARGYFFLAAAIAGYFALTSRPIPPNRAKLYVTLFFLSGLTAMISNLAFVAGPKFYFLYDFFPPEIAVEQATAEGSLAGGLGRISGLMWGSLAVVSVLLARYGIAGTFDLTRPWRILVILLGIGAGLFAGFRSAVILLALTFLVLFLVEGLWRTRFLFIVILIGTVLSVGMVLFADRMPLPVQRALSFLPLQIDLATRQSAEASTQWRIEMWKALLPEVPRYLLIGKGYAINSQDLGFTAAAAARGQASSSEVSALAGDYHSGPLSVVIPFGIWGAGAFLWFLGAGLRVLYRNHRFGAPELKQVNAFLLAFFIARSLFFFAIYGALQWDLFYFTGLVGLSVALNSGVWQSRTQSEPGLMEPARA